jgi:predicted PurR-regulated permease PerM
MSDGESAARRLGRRRLFQRSLVVLVAVLVVIGLGWLVVSPFVEEQAKFDAVKADFAQTWCETYGENPRDIASASESWLSFVERNRDFLEENASRLGVTSTSLDGTTKKTTMIELTVEEFADGLLPPESFWFGYAFPAHFEFFDFGGGWDVPPEC